MPSKTELDVLLDRVREDRADPHGKNRNVVVYDCWRMFEDLAARYQEEFTMRDRYKRQANSWCGAALGLHSLLYDLADWLEGEGQPGYAAEMRSRISKFNLERTLNPEER